MPRMPDNSYVSSSIDAARQARKYLRMVEDRTFSKLMDEIDDDAIRAAQGKPGFAHPGNIVLVMCQILVGAQKRIGQSSIPLVDAYLRHLEKSTGAMPDIWVPGDLN